MIVEPGRLQRHDLVARRDDVRLQHPVEQRRTARRVRRHHVVRAERRRLRVQRAYRDRVRRIARRVDPADHQLAVLGLPDVPRRGDDDDPVRHRALHRAAQRVVVGRLEHRVAQRQVDDPDVELLRGCAIAQSIASTTSLTVPTPSASSTFRFTRCAPGATPLYPSGIVGSSVAPRRDDARHVRAVAERVLARAAARREVHLGHDAAADRRQARHARVDQRDADAPAVVARQPLEAAPHLVGADRLAGHGHRAPHGHVTRQVRHRFVGRHRGERAGRHLDDRAVGEPPLRLDAVAGGQRRDLVAAARHDHVHRSGRAARQVALEVRRQARAASLSGRRQAGGEHEEGKGRESDAPREPCTRTGEHTSSRTNHAGRIRTTGCRSPRRPPTAEPPA